MRGRQVKRLFRMNPQFDRDTLAQRGFTVAPGLLDAATCRNLAALWPQQALFRKHIVMQRHGYGQVTGPGDKVQSGRWNDGKLVESAP